MNITVLTAGTLGDVMPYALLGQALIQRGHSVKITSNEDYAATLGATGVQFHLVRDPFRLSDDEASRKVMDSGGGKEFVRQIREQPGKRLRGFLEECQEACRDADLILYANLGFAGPHIGEAMNIPYFAVPLSPTFITGDYPAMDLPERRPFRHQYNRLTHRYAEWFFWRQIGPTINAWRRDGLGLRPAPFWGPFGRIRRTGYPFIYLISETLFPRPDDWPSRVHLTGFIAPDEGSNAFGPHEDISSFLVAGEAPVVFAFGANWSHDRESAESACVRAAESLGLRAVMCEPGSRKDVQRLGENVIRVGFVDQLWLFSRACIVMHHGGAGTTYQALRSGMPSTAFPRFGDQFLWSRMLAKLGCGPAARLDGKLGEDSLRLALQDFSTNQQVYRDRARAVAADLRRERPVEAAVDLIERSYSQFAAQIGTKAGPARKG